MPTPFYHLSIAKDLLQHPGLNSDVLQLLQQRRAAFLFGLTAPDVQTISGQHRIETHFYDVPILPNSQPAWVNLFNAYPELSYWKRLSSTRQAFLVGYLCHLQADWLWVLQIYTPFFGPGLEWQKPHQRIYLHNVLRAYLDLELLPSFPTGLSDELATVTPDDWLPFVQDKYLIQWRDFLVGQLCQGCESQTVKVFANRQGISPDAFLRLLNSEERMEKEIFSRLPRQVLQAFRHRLINENILLMNQLLETDQVVQWDTGIYSYEALSFNNNSGL